MGRSRFAWLWVPDENNEFADRTRTYRPSRLTIGLTGSGSIDGRNSQQPNTDPEALQE
ncbi:hypothetical protein Ancab_038071, partial [Ancistrocladus abbreviatus]